MFRSQTDIYVPKKEVQNERQILYRCNFCSDGYLSETEVEVHKKVVHKKQIWKIVQSDNINICKICLVELATDEDLIKHIKTDHLHSSETAERVEREIFVCHNCEEIFFNKLLLAAHINYFHVKIKKNKFRVECPKCFKLIKVSNLWVHFQFHEIQSVALCPICIKKCRNRQHMKEHILSHNRYYFCNICGYEGLKESNFYQHIKNHRQENNRRESNNEFNCVKYFIPNLDTPWKYHHQYGLRGISLNKITVCILCREICENIQRMQEHILKEHYPIRLKKKCYICQCGQEFSNNILLKHHVFKLKEGHKPLEQGDSSKMEE